MSSTTPVCFGDEMFWAHDVAAGILFAEAARVAEEVPPGRRMPWWEEMVRTLRVNAVVGSSHAVTLDAYSAQELSTLLSWLAEAASRLETRGGVSRAEVERWDVLDGHTVPLPGTEHVDAGPVVELARAMAALTTGTLPPAPEGRHWYFGTPAGRVLQGGATTGE